MGRTTLYLGGDVEGVNPIANGLPRPSWPDIDSQGLLADAGAGRFANIKAIALAAATDWDLVRVKLAVAGEELLGPGRLLVIPDNDSISNIEPVLPVLPTRLYDATAQRKGDVPQLDARWSIDVSGGGVDHIRNVTAGTLNVWKWDGGAWVAFATVAAGGVVLAAVTGNPVNINGNALHERATDYSPDGVWSFADYAAKGAILFSDGSNASGLSYVTSFAFGNLGTAGDTTDPTTVRYGFRWGALTSQFFGRLAVDVFDGDCVDWAPRLPPQRTLVLPALNIAESGGGTFATQAIVTVPAFNVDGVEFLFRNPTGSGVDIYVALVEPSPASGYNSTSGVTIAATPPTYATVPDGEDGCFRVDAVRHPMLKILMGASGAVTIPAGAMLTLTRRLDR